MVSSAFYSAHLEPTQVFHELWNAIEHTACNVSLGYISCDTECQALLWYQNMVFVCGLYNCVSSPQCKVKVQDTHMSTWTGNYLS